MVSTTGRLPYIDFLKLTSIIDYQRQVKEKKTAKHCSELHFELIHKPSGDVAENIWSARMFPSRPNKYFAMKGKVQEKLQKKHIHEFPSVHEVRIT